MDFRALITIHVYGGDKLNTYALVPHSKYYGCCGKEIIAPLRKINGKEIVISDVPDNFLVKEFWNWIVIEIYKDELKGNIENICDTSFYNTLEKFFVFEDLRYEVRDDNKPLNYYLRLMDVNTNDIKVELLVCEDEGDFFIDDGIRYYLPSHESGRHHCPHVHVNIKHESSGTFSIITGEELDGDIKRKKYLKKIKNTILSKQCELLEFWNKNTDGLKVDVNQFLGIIDY